MVVGSTVRSGTTQRIMTHLERSTPSPLRLLSQTSASAVQRGLGLLQTVLDTRFRLSITDVNHATIFTRDGQKMTVPVNTSTGTATSTDSNGNQITTTGSTYRYPRRHRPHDFQCGNSTHLLVFFCQPYGRPTRRSSLSTAPRV